MIKLPALKNPLSGLKSLRGGSTVRIATACVAAIVAVILLLMFFWDKEPELFDPQVRAAALRLADASGYARTRLAGSRVEAA